MPRTCCLFELALYVCLTAPGSIAFAQTAAIDSAAPIPMLVVGSMAEDRLRVNQLLGRASTAGWMIRAASVLSDTTPLSWHAARLKVVQPSVDVTWNSDLPFSLNDGAQWAGRGITAAAAGGFSARIGKITMNVVPQVWRAENGMVAVLPGGSAGRKGYSSPWHTGIISADLPLRFGYRTTTSIDPGESAIWFTSRNVAAGLSNESQWWGPGLRNALLMSNNAGGIPHAFVRSAAPVRTRFGDVEGRLILGGLTESRFFDFDAANDLRSLSGTVVAFTPAREPNLTAGIARVVYATVKDAGALPARSFDALFRWGEGGKMRAPTPGGSADQLTSLFARWVFPQSGAEVYGEWARVILPSSLRSLLVAPQYSQGFTVGAQWLARREQKPLYRIQVELTNLEQSPPSKAADTVSFYTSPGVVQGYTQRGQVIGASIGPGSSSQWVATDRLGESFDVGVFVGRIRWDTDAYYTQSTSIYYLSYDASVFTGARASVRMLARELTAEILLQRRYNYLFQNAVDGWSADPVFDKSNTTLRLRVR